MLIPPHWADAVGKGLVTEGLGVLTCYVTFRVFQRYGWRGFWWVFFTDILFRLPLIIILGGELGRTSSRAVSVAVTCTGLCLWLMTRHKKQQ